MHTIGDIALVFSAWLAETPSSAKTRKRAPERLTSCAIGFNSLESSVRKGAVCVFVFAAPFHPHMGVNRCPAQCFDLVSPGLITSSTMRLRLHLSLRSAATPLTLCGLLHGSSR